MGGRRATIVFCLALSALPAPAGAADDLARLDQEWLLAYNERNAGPVRRIWSEDARLVATTGRVKSKAEEIEDVTAPEPPELKAQWSVADQIVREYGDTGVVIGRFAQKGTWSGQPFERPYRYTNVYAKTRGEWQMISSHWSKISD